MESINCGGDTEHNLLPSSAFYQERYPNLFHTIFFFEKNKNFILSTTSCRWQIPPPPPNTYASEPRTAAGFATISLAPPYLSPQIQVPQLAPRPNHFLSKKIRSHFCGGSVLTKKINKKNKKIPGITSCLQLSPDQRNTSHFGGLCRESSLMNCSPWGISEKFGLLPTWADQLCMATAPSNRGKAFALSTALNQLSVCSLFIRR